MRIFIGFKWQNGDGVQTTVPVMYGDMTRQVANIIRENSENKMPTVPRIACYITGLELDTGRISDPSFVSKTHIRQRAYDIDSQGQVDWQNHQGGYFTVERLLPTPYTLKMKADIWTSNTDQKLQLLEQIAVLFHPSLEIQTTDNFIDWTSLTVVDLTGMNFSSRSIPQGTETEIDVCSVDFQIPIYISPPVKVKKLGIIKTIIANIFTEDGNVADINTLVYNDNERQARVVIERFRIMVFASNNGQANDYDVTIIDPGTAVRALKIPEKDIKIGGKLDWYQILDIQGGYTATSRIYLQQPNGFEIAGTFAINPVNPEILVVNLDPDTVPQNTIIESPVSGISARGTVDAIIDPYKFNPLITFGSHSQIPLGLRYLMLDDVNTSQSVGDSGYDGPDAWKNSDGSDPVIKANSIIEWSGSAWNTVFDPEDEDQDVVVQNLRTKIKYRWIDGQWLKAFEGEYSPGFWRLDLDA
jgi:hypothetical protein